MQQNRGAGRALPLPSARFALLCVMAAAIGLLTSGVAGAAGKIKVSKAAYSARSGKLIVKGKANGTSGPVEIFDLNGRRLGTGPSGAFALTAQIENLVNIPCGVRVQSGDTDTVVKVAGAPKSCRRSASCKITSPVGGAALKAYEAVNFSAAVSGKGPIFPVKYQWDFAGGALGHPAGNLGAAGEATASATFMRDNSLYRVRFAMTDAQGRRCEDAVEVAVGTPPSGLPAKVGEAPAPGIGSETSGLKGDLVVLPNEDWTMQSDSDATFMPSLYNSMSPTIHNLKSVVYRKDRLPVVVNDAQVTYSAASNPGDPVGADSINSTSQNWPLNPDIKAFSPMLPATVQKSQIWEKYRGDWPAGKADNYKAGFWGAFGSTFPFSPLPEASNPEPDEGYIIGRGEADTKDGSFMPGKANPFLANDAQAFGKFDTETGQYAVNLLPLSDVDDQGRVNPYPLFRVQASQGGQTAATDAVMTASRDFQCRGCHAKGQIAANPNAPHTRAAFASTPATLHNGSDKLTPIDKPVFYDAKGSSIYDQEYAAALNYSSIHDFYDGYEFAQIMQRGNLDENGKVTVDGPIQCTGCHNTAMRAVMFGEDWYSGDDFDTTSHDYDPNYTVAMHRFHGELQYNDAKTDIIRDEKGMYVRWDWKTQGANTRTLFPIFDAQGKQLPMEENCLRCHAGQRESHYRDRMSTAGVTCYDCHGDMLAVGEAYPKNYPAKQAKLGSTDLNDYRVAWFDNPDCGSCHVGDGNRGKDKANGFFSAGVRTRAFEDADPSATTRAVDRNDPNAVRFAVAPVKNYTASFPTTIFRHEGDQNVETKVDAPVFRFGKDTHGNVPCASCHGAAHAIWPNADPSANDNQTALQLQGHTGHILECNVCHTADSFAKLEDNDGGQYSGDPKPGILGGPHNLHPVNDPVWWKQANGDVANTDGSNYGGWHNNYAKTSGKNGEDQCAACHGNDHKGLGCRKRPVDRVFDFRGLDFGKLKKAGFKSKIVKVAAGTQIGCDTCHRLDLSFTGSPGRTANQTEAKLD